jgi:hypothetical protein
MSASTNQSVAGGCLCGAVRFKAVVEAAEMGVCHCSMCRRWSGGAFMAVPCIDMTIEDETELGVYPSSEWGQREFCKRCGSSLFWRLRQDNGHVAVALPALDAVEGLAFGEEIYIDEKPALYAFAGDRPRLTGAEFLARIAAQQEAGA